MNYKLTFLRAVSLTALVVGLSGVAAQAQNAFTAGDLVVYRIGTGAAGLTNASTAVFLDEYSPTGTLVQSVALPSSNTASGSHNLTASGTATSEGMLTLSGNGQYLAVTGYDSVAGVTGIAATTSTAVPRVVDVVGANGAVASVTDLNAFSGNNIRSAYTADGSSIYAVGNGTGVVYATAGAASFTTVSSTATNLRNINVFSGQLYVSSGSGSLRLGTVGTGTPTTTGQTITNLPGFETTGSPYQFFFATLNAGSTSPDTLYVADDTATTGGIQKWSFSSGAWTLNNTITSAAGIRGITGFVTGSTVTLYGTTGGSGATGRGSIYSLTDTSGYNVANNGTTATIATAATNEAFRGIAFAPQFIASAGTPEPSVLPLVAEASALVLGFGLMRRRRKA